MNVFFSISVFQSMIENEKHSVIFLSIQEEKKPEQRPITNNNKKCHDCDD